MTRRTKPARTTRAHTHTARPEAGSSRGAHCTGTRIRATLALLGATALLAGSAGCAGITPQPDKTTTAPCSPETTRVDWQPKYPGEPAETGYEVASVDADGTADVTEHVVEYASQISGEFGEPLDLPALAGDDWVPLLNEEFERTGQIESTSIGEPAPGFGSVSYEYIPSTTMILGFRTSQIRVPFSLSCGGADVAEGTFTTTDGADVISVLVDCATPDPVTTDPATRLYALDLLEYCPAA